MSLPTAPTAAPSSTPLSTKSAQWTIEIVKRSDTVRGFVVLPRRWVVECTLAWLNRNRRLAKDFETSLQKCPYLAIPCQRQATHATSRQDAATPGCNLSLTLRLRELRLHGARLSFSRRGATKRSRRGRVSRGCLCQMDVSLSVGLDCSAAQDVRGQPPGALA